MDRYAQSIDANRQIYSGHFSWRRRRYVWFSDGSHDAGCTQRKTRSTSASDATGDIEFNRIKGVLDRIRTTFGEMGDRRMGRVTFIIMGMSFSLCMVILYFSKEEAEASMQPFVDFVNAKPWWKMYKRRMEARTFDDFYSVLSILNFV